MNTQRRQTEVSAITEVPSSILLLGMVFTEYSKLISHKNTKLGITVLDRPNRGQEYRDMVRCKGLESLGFDVRTLDNKHSIDRAVDNKHCQASFCDPRRLRRSIADAFEGNQFEYIILDYFFSPVGWARERWGMIFFNQTLPMLAKEKILKPGGFIILPNIQCVDENITNSLAELSEFYDIEKMSNPFENPLFRATDLNNVSEELLSCPDMLTNETQLRPLNEESPFFKLINKTSGHITLQASTTAAVTAATAVAYTAIKRKKRNLTTRTTDESDNVESDSSNNNLDSSFTSTQTSDDSFDMDDANSKQASNFRKQMALLKRHNSSSSSSTIHSPVTAVATITTAKKARNTRSL